MYETTNQPSKLPCGHDDDFAHLLTIIVGLHFYNTIVPAVRAGRFDNETWHGVQTKMIEDFKSLFASVDAQQPVIKDHRVKPPERLQ